MSRVTDTHAAVLRGGDLRAARRVVRDISIRELETFAEHEEFGTALILRGLGDLVRALGCPGDLLHEAGLGSGHLRLEQIEWLVTAARWADILGEDAAENCWGVATPAARAAGKVARRHAADGRRVLRALGASRGNPTGLSGRPWPEGR